MPETALQDGTSSFLNKKQLIKLRLKTMRAGVWFRALPRIDRALVDLTIKVASNVRSITLAKNIFCYHKETGRASGKQSLAGLERSWSPTRPKTQLGSSEMGCP